jgi:hypothetical protein
MIFGSKPKERGSPLEQNDHPELDESPLLDTEGISLYQSLIGAAQWVVSLGRFDIMTALVTMSQFRIAPRQGHLERLKQIYGYLRRFKTASLRVEVDPPDYSHMEQLQHDWSYSVYGDVEKLVPKDVPEPLGKPVILSHYCDANLCHDLITGRAVTGILHFVNGMVIDWYSKKQATVETATYGAEFVAARIAIDQIVDLRLFLRYMGIPIVGISYLFGDNQSVFLSSTLLQSSLKKRHNALSYHRVREAIAAKIAGMFKIPTDKNYSDVVTKHWGHTKMWPTLKQLFFLHKLLAQDKGE